MANKVFKGKDGIIRNIYTGDQDYDTIDDVVQKTKEFYREVGKPLKILVNLEHVGRLNKGVLLGALKALRTNIYEKIAIVKSTVIYRALSHFVIKASGREDKIKFFDEEDEALGWLKSRKKEREDYYQASYT